MPSLFVFNGWCKAMSLFRVDMNNRWSLRSLHAFKHLDEFAHVVALFQIQIVEAPRLKPVVLTRAVAFPQRPQIFVDATVVFGNRHLVVVHHDDDARSEFRSLVKSLKRFAARERPVANDGNDVFVRFFDVACLLQSRRQTDGGGGVPHPQNCRTSDFLRATNNR